MFFPLFVVQQWTLVLFCEHTYGCITDPPHSPHSYCDDPLLLIYFSVQMQNCCYLSVTPLLTVRNNSSHSPHPLCEVSIIVTHIMSSRWRDYDQTARTLWHHYLIIILRSSRTELRCVSAWAKRYHVFLLCAVPSHFEVTVIETQIMTSHQLTLLPHFIVAMSSLSLCYLRLSLNRAQMTVIPFLLMRSRTWAPFRHERKWQ